MRRKQVLAFLMSVCLAAAPVLSASADSETESGGRSAGAITEDFQSVEDSWGMTGTLADENKLSIITEGNGNKYLAVNGERYATRTAAKSFGDMPEMETAAVSFKWYTTALKSDSSKGRPGITLKSGGTEIVSVYMGEARPENNPTATKMYYSTQDTGVTEIEGKTLKTTEANDVAIAIDFRALKATVTVNGEEYVTVDVNPAAVKVDTLMLNMEAGDLGAGKAYVVNMGIDDFSLSYESAAAGHDYENTFTSGEIDWTAWGRDVDSVSGTGGYSFQIKQEDGNAYLYGEVERAGAGRGSRVDLPGGIVKGASIQFDWMPVIVNGGHADILFMSPKAKQNYFTLYADSTGALHYYTAADANNSTTIDSSFAGVITESSAAAVNVGELGKWATVKIDFDYMAHTASLTVTSKEDSSKTYTMADIPISPDANGLSLMVMRKPASCAKSGNALDNICVDYFQFDAGDIVSVANPAAVNMVRDLYGDYQLPEAVTVTLGDGSKTQVGVKNWVCEPEFDLDRDGTYQWTAQLEPGGLTNYFGLGVSLTMNYTQKYYVNSVNNPPTQEVEYGQGWSEDALPKTATVVLSGGEVVTDAPVGEWHPIRGFDSQQEGIYIYGADLTEDDRYTLIKEKITPSEYHGDAAGDELKEAFVYDVYYRVSYYKNNDNYNGYVRSMENLNRGVTAVNSDDGILVSWRLLVDEYGSDISFNVLRNGGRINSAPITDKTNYLDNGGKAGDTYAVEVIKGGASSVSASTEALAQNYLSVKVQKPDPQPNVDGRMATYSLNDAGVADVDGDGQYEVVVKWYPSDAFDSGAANSPSAPTIFDCYRLDGTPLWRLNLGLEMPSGAHFNQFMFYDLDADGKAEFFVKTSDGTVTYRPNAEGLFDMEDESTIVSYIGDRSVVPGTNVNSNGHMSSSTNEYVSVFKGLTGEEISTIPYENSTGNYTDWGYAGGGKNDGGNRSARYNIALAYLPADQNDPDCTETVPAVLLNRGYYDKTTVIAYSLRDGKLTKEWNFVTENGTDCAGKGNHNVATGDMDNDGFDELVIGALAIDHDGSVLWVKDGKDGRDFQGHADTIHLTAMNPDKPTQLYVFTPSEHKESTLNGTLSNGANGSRINGTWSRLADIGRAVAANITPLPGFEYWADMPTRDTGAKGAIFNTKGQVLATTPPASFASNWVLYWDGDLLSELGDGAGTEGNMVISKYNWEENTVSVLDQFEGTKLDNWTKNNPCLTADLFGDWREEVLVRSEDNTELRIYMTDYGTDYMIYTLMHDPVYRNAVANQNSGYNQPPHLGFYLGEDNKEQVLAKELPTAKVVYTSEN